MPWEHARFGLLLASGTGTLLWFGHGCIGDRMLLEQERYYGLGTDALVIVCSWYTKDIMVWACMLGKPHAFGTRTLLWFGHGCAGNRMHSKMNNAMPGIRSILGPRNTSNMWFVPTNF